MELVVKVGLRQPQQRDTVYLVPLEVFLHAVNRFRRLVRATTNRSTGLGRANTKQLGDADGR